MACGAIEGEGEPCYRNITIAWRGTHFPLHPSGSTTNAPLMQSVGLTKKDMTCPADISDKVVHFTRGDTWEDAFGALCEIVEAGQLIGSNGNIKGGYPCVCFSEAPLNSLPDGLVNPAAYSKYSPFGIIFEKSFLFQHGGRPVIYQPDSEYEDLPENIRWRHVRYEPDLEPVIDFTWEREWRIQTESLTVSPDICDLVFPNREWGEKMRCAHQEQQEFLVQEYSLIFDENIAEQYREQYPWVIYSLAE